jgi:hypothetical protein
MLSAITGGYSRDEYTPEHDLCIPLVELIGYFNSVPKKDWDQQHKTAFNSLKQVLSKHGMTLIDENKWDGCQKDVRLSTLERKILEASNSNISVAVIFNDIYLSRTLKHDSFSGKKEVVYISLDEFNKGVSELGLEDKFKIT